jgi:hypothetical protein
MITNVINPYAINIVAAFGFFVLASFIITRVLTAAPVGAISSSAEPSVEAAHVVMQEDYSGIIAWVTPQDIKITDTTGVSRTFAIDSATHILVKGFPIGSATYANLRVLDHTRITAINDNSNERAQTIVVQ